MKRFTSFFVVCIALLWGFCGNARAATWTYASDAPTTNEYIPIYGYWADNNQHIQFIYPKSAISDLADAEITGLKFYTNAGYDSYNFEKNGNKPTYVITLLEVANSSLGTDFKPITGGQQVFSGQMTISSSQRSVSWSTPFVYSGTGHLLVDIQYTTAGGYGRVYFQGKMVANAARYQYGSNSAAVQNFLPKTTFTYTPGAAPTCPKPGAPSASSIDDESATITWTAGGTEGSWNFRYKASSAAVWTTINGLTNRTYDLSGLSANTLYNVEVQADCGGGDLSDWKVGTFQTACGFIRSLPWNSDAAFAATTTNYAIPECWSRAITSYYSNPGMMSSGSYMQFSGNNNKDNKDKNMAIIVLPKFTTDIKNLKVTIEYSTASTGGGYPQFFLGYILESEMSDATKFHSLQTLPKTSGVGTYTTSTPFTLSGATSGARVAICYNNQTTTSTSSSVTVREGRIKKIIVEAVQDCNMPQSVTCTGTTGTTASFSWTARAGVPTYQYCVVARDAAADWSGNLTTNTNSCTATGLSASTNYDFYVKCVCGGGVAGPVQFTTDAACPSVTGVTLSNKVFNGVTVNWTTSSATNCDVRYKAGSGAWNTAGTDISATSKAITGLSVGTTYTFEVKPSCSADGWVAAGETYTPTCPAVGALTISGERYNGVTVSWSAVAGISTYNLRYRKGSDSWTTVNDIAALTYTISSGLVTNQEYTIEVQTECEGSWSSTTYTPTAPAPTVAGANSITETSISAVCTDMSGNGATGHQYILVARGAAEDWSSPNALNPAGTSVTGLTIGTKYDLYVRAVYGGIYSASTKKSFATKINAPTGLTRGALTSTSVVFSWTAGGGATQYQCLCLPSATTPTESNWSSSTLVNTTSVTMTGLTANTSYKFHVRAICNDTVSAKVSSSAFTTPCGTEDIPYSANFNSNATKPACWTCDRWSSEAGYWYTYLIEGTNYGLRYYGNNTSQTADIQTPSIYLSDKADLTFNYSNNYSKHPIPSSVIISNGVTTKTVDLPTTANSTLTSYTIDLSNVSGTDFTGTTVTITFRGSASSNASYSYFILDDVSITAKTCTPPTANAVSSITSNSAVITWTDSRAEEWSVRYRTYNVGEWTVVNNLTVKSYTMTGLSPETEYEVQVRNDCSASSSSWTDSNRFTTTSLCPTPSGLTNTNTTYNSVTVTWTAGGDETGWNVQTKPDGGSWSASTHVASASYVMSGLTPGTTYHYRVQADCGGAWVEGTYTPVCPTITAITLTNETVTGVHVNWTLSGGNVPCSVRYRSALELLIWHTAVSDTEETSCAISGLTPDVEYQIQVKTACGDWMDAENYTPRILPPTPTITAYDGSVKVTWNNVLLASGYQYVVVPRDAAHSWSSAVSVATNPTDANPLIISGLSAGTAYDLYVRTIYGLVPSLERKEPFATITMAPVGLTNTDLTSTTASFTWNKAANSSATQFQWACKPGSTAPSAGDWSEPLGTDVRNYTVTDLNDGADYTFYVRTYYSEGVYSSAVSLAFTTECGIKQLDYIENFEGGNPPCWTTTLEEWSTGGNRWSVYDDEGHQMRFNANTNSATINYLIMPQIYLFTEALLSFRVKNVYYPVSSPEYVQGFVVVTDGETERQFSLINASSFTKQTIDLAEFAGKTVTIKFYSPDKLTHTAFLELDDVAVKAVETWIFTNNTGDGLWTTKGNWDKGIKEDRIPTITDDVSIRKPATVNDEHATAKSIVIDHSNGNTGKITIPALKGLEVAGSIQLNTGSSLTSTTPADLILESSEGGNASLIFNNSNGNSASVAMYSKGNIDYTDPEKPKGIKNYQYIGVPVSEANALYNYYGSWLYSWSDKGSGYGWQKVPTGGSVYAWTGYCITQETPKVYSISGTLVPTTYHDIEVPAGENMVIGNSWTAPIDISTLNTETDMENLAGNIYFFNTGVDKTGDAGGTDPGDGTRYAGSTYLTVPVNSAKYMADNHINSMQGFFVKNTSESEGTLHLNYDSHVRGTTRGSIIGDAMHAPRRAVAESNDPVVLWLTVVGEHYDDRLLLLERKDFSYGFDNGWDGDKWDGNESVLYLYTLDSEGTENSVSAVPDFEGTIVGFRAGADNAYTMYFEYLNSDATLYLFDTETNSYTRIENGGSYWFTTQDREKHQRFIITRSNGLETPTGVEPTSDSSLKGRAKKLLINDKMYILLNGKLYDATGKAVR